MALPPIPEQPFTPREQRDSETTGFGTFAKKLGLSVLITKGAALAGGFVGGKAYGKVGMELGASAAGLAAGVHEAHKHWAPIKATQLRVEEILPEVQQELDPRHLEAEAALQKEITAKLDEREQLFTALVGERRAAAIEPRGNATDALAKESANQSFSPPGR